MTDIKNKIVIVTGSASGIGRGIAELFAKEGARIVVSDITDSKGKEVVKSIRKKKRGKAIYVHCDVSKEDEVKKMIQTTIDTYGGLTTIINNAAVTTNRGDGPITEIEEERWEKLLSTDLKGVYLCCKHSIPEMIKSRGGSIINISSIVGLGGSRINPIHAYHTAKAGVINLTRAIATHYGSQKIRCNAICPGIIRTPWNRSSLKNQKGLKKFIGGMPLGKSGVGTPEDVAYLALFLASDISSIITGAIIPIDGGASATVPL